MSDHTKTQVPPSSPDNTIHHHPDEKRARSSSSSSSSSLATLLLRDIHPQEGHRLILSFLDTADCLRLSECCQALLDYRYHLSKVKVIPHPSPTPGNRRGLARLLLEQRGGLEYLRVEHESVLHVLDLASEGCFKGLKTLKLVEAVMEEDGHREELGEEEEVCGF